jgi:CubicO group peptidase (beta-lactamase class C family)
MALTTVRFRLMATVSGLLLLATIDLASQSNATFDLSPLEAVAMRELADTHTPGGAIAIVLGERVIYTRGFGLASVETRELVRPEMLFRLGSTTKMFTATALVSLAEKGAIDLNRPIGDYVKVLDPKIERLTAHQLLSHTAGLLDEAPMFGANDESALANEIRSWTGSRFFAEPSKIYSYSNPGYWLVGFMVESLSHKPYAEQMEAGVFKPLGMTRTTLHPLVAMTYPIAQGHDYTAQGPIVVRPAANNTASWPAGSIFSNVIDLSRFVMAFVNGGRLDGARVLSPTLISTMTTPHAKIPGGVVSYGYGLELMHSRGVDIVRHGGSRSGYGSMIVMVPQRHFGVITLANRTGSTLSRTANKAMEIVLSLEPAAPPQTRHPMKLDAAEISEYVGTYFQGSAKIEIVNRNGKIYFKQETLDSGPLEKMAEGELESDDVLLFMVRGPSGAVEYVYAGGRSWRKVN